MNLQIMSTHLLRTRALIFNLAVVAIFSFFGHGSFKAQADEMKLKVGVISGLTGAASAFAASRSVAKVKGSEFVPAFRPVKSNSWYNQIRDGNIGVCLDQNSPIFSTFL